MAFPTGSVVKSPAGLGPRQDAARTSLTGLTMLVPAGLLLAVLFVTPVLMAAYLGFTNLELVGARSRAYGLTGLANFARMADDDVFWGASLRTLFLLLGSAVIGQTVLGLALALLIRRGARTLGSFIGGLAIVAWVIPEVTAAFVWYAFTQAGGTLSVLTGDPTRNFLVAAPMAVIAVAATWRNVAFSMLIFSAGLRTVPAEMSEAASLEGADWWVRLRRVTLPMIRSTLLTNLLLVTILNLTQFTLIYVMTQGGPGNSSTTLPIYVYREAFSFFQLGYGTSIGLVLLVIGAALSLTYVVASGRRGR